MKTTTRRLGATAAGTLLALSLAGCGKLAEEAIEQAVENESGEDIEIDFDAEDGTLSIEGENGEEFNFDLDEDGETSTFSGTDEDGDTFEMTTGTDIPDAWPGNVPVPPGTVTSATAMSDNTEQILNISTEVSDAEAAHEGYVAQLTSLGFTSGSTSSFESDGTSSAFTEMSNDTWTALVSSTSDGEGSEAMIVSLQSVSQ